MYIALEEAKEEVWKRWNDTELRRRVLEYVGELPDVLCEGPKAVWYRSLATPSFECLLFDKISKNIGLKSLYFEYLEDKFCVMNPDKVAMGKMTFFHGKGKKNGHKTTIQRVVEFNQCSGKKFDSISTSWGMNFVGFHRKLLVLEMQRSQKYDLATWCKEHGGTPSAYYHLVMALFVCHGILFENFLEEGDEGNFTREIAWPAIQKVTEHFGLKPLIVRLRPEKTEADPYWCWYPGHLEAEVKKLMEGSSVGQVPERRGREACLVGANSAGR